MKASSMGLEIEVKINSNELRRLEEEPLSGTLGFLNHSEPQMRRDIPIRIIYHGLQKEFLSVKQSPRDIYFGEANDIRFIINDEFYDILIEKGSFGDRFYTIGKLIIKVAN